MVELVRLHDGAPSLEDIPGRLRRIADQIEAGEQGAVETAYVLLPTDGDYPRLFGFGDVHGKSDPVVQFELAKLWLLTNLVERA